MAIGLLATIKIQAGKNAEFEAVAKELMAAVRANESGNKVYQFCRSRDDESTYVVMEVYADQAALDTHGKTDHFRTIGAKMGPFMAGRPDLKFFEAV